MGAPRGNEFLFAPLGAGRYADRPGVLFAIASSWWFCWLVCWGGFLFDGTISLLLCHRRRKVRYGLGFPAAVSHASFLCGFLGPVSASLID